MSRKSNDSDFVSCEAGHVSAHKTELHHFHPHHHTATSLGFIHLSLANETPRKAMSSYHDILLQHVIPGLGVITGTFLSFAPYRAVLHASREGHLGHLNPTPWAVMMGKCLGWLCYAIMLGNMYVFMPNASGCVLSIWLNVQAIKLITRNSSNFT